MWLLNDFLPHEEYIEPWIMPGSQYPGLPDDKTYDVQEQFSQNPDLNCKMAVIEIFRPHEAHELGQILGPAAVIDYDWSEEHTAPEPTLAPESPKDELAERLLEAYKILLQDEAYWKQLNEHCMWMKNIASQLKNDSPRKPVSNQNKHIGRNDPCLCGSGKKYKKCCLIKT